MNKHLTKYIKILGVGMLTPLAGYLTANSKPINKMFGFGISSRNLDHLRVDSSNFDMNELNEIIKRRGIYGHKTRRNKITWMKLVDSLDKKHQSVIWELMPEDYMPAYYKPTKQFIRPQSYHEAKKFYNLVEPNESDYQPYISLGQSFPTANHLKGDEFEISFYTLSSLSGGDGGGTGNQNYASKIELGLTDKTQLSLFYSVSDDPLYSKVNSNDKATPNYWEKFGSALKIALKDSPIWKASLSGSFESWNIRSGEPNMFNNSGELLAKRIFVGSVNLPISLNLSRKVQVHLSPGISFIPSEIGNSKNGYGTFYGKNIYFATGISWKPIAKLGLSASSIFPMGPGTNHFNSSLEFRRKAIYNAGINWDISPRIGLEGMLTNGFGATPSTGILTIPSSNQLGYYAGIKYKPNAIDTPQQELNNRDNYLSKGGLTVNTAIIPAEGTSQLWANFDSSGNIFGYFGHSLSNIMQLEAINIGSFENVSDRGNLRKGLVRRYANNKSLNTRLGGKFVLMSPLRGSPFWLSGRVSGGRNQDKESQQGYLFAELISTFKVNNWMSVNINPKVAWNGFSTPKGLGISAHIDLSKSYKFISEVNIVGGENGDTNSTIALRWLANDFTALDFYVSTAAGLQDLGQLLGSYSPRIGAKLIFTY